MSETIEARMLQKHSSAREWRTNPNFVPKKGEIIVYDYNINEDESIQTPRFKIGDGQNKVEDLKFIVGELYAQSEPPSDAGEGAVWFAEDGNPSSGSGNNTVGAPSDWDSTINEPGYVNNRPLWHEPVKITWNGTSYDSSYTTDNYGTIYQLNSWINLAPRGQELVGASVQIDGRAYTIADYCRTYYEIEKYTTAASPTLVITDGIILGFASETFVAVLINQTTITPIFLSSLRVGVLGANSLKGFYAFKINSYFTKLEYEAIKIKEEYTSFFDNFYNPIHVVHVSNSNDVNVDFSLFKPGDIIFAVAGLSEQEGINGV